jgi:DNA invertase Pin-like site-specific DNA recombinase
MKIGYKRVSTQDQKTDRQLEGLTLDSIFEDVYTGKSKERPQLIACVNFIRETDELYIHSIDRLARSLSDLLELVKQIIEKKCKLIFVKEGLVFDNSENNPTSKLMLALIGAVAEFELELIKQRIKDGISAAKQKGWKTKPTTYHLKPEVDRMLAQGYNKIKIAQDLGISQKTVYNLSRRKPDVVLN